MTDHTAASKPTGSVFNDWFRWLVVAAQAVSIMITWPLWEARESPPNLPLLDGIQFDVGWALLASLLVILVRPLLGTILHSVLLGLAISMDQMRIQPEFLSLAVLLWGTLKIPSAQTLCRVHLTALWFYAGLHKILSVEYITGTGKANWQRMLSGISDEFASALAVLVALLEMTMAVMIVFPRLRRSAAWLVFIVHLGILGYLAASNWNVAVWPWNVALALSGFALFMSWRDSALQTWNKSNVLVRIAAGVLLVMPIGYYFGVVDAYLAHCLYSSNKPTAKLYTLTIAETTDQDAPNEFRVAAKPTDLSKQSLSALRVPFPPAHRLFESFYDRVAQPGDFLVIQDPRKWAERKGWSKRKLTLDGKRVLRHATNAKAAEGMFVNGKEHGRWRFWFPNGKPWIEGEFRHGVEVGRWTYWDEQGNKEVIDVD